MLAKLFYRQFHKHCTMHMYWFVLSQYCMVYNSFYFLLIAFQSYGWCAFGRRCRHSHHIDHILDLVESKSQRKRRKRQKRANPSESSDKGDTKVVEKPDDSEPAADVGNKDVTNGKPTEEGCPVNTQIQRAEGHRAGYDAFMTGFCYSYDILRYSRLKTDCVVEKLTFDNFDMVAEFGNKIYLSGKDIPLQLCRSEYAKTSKGHCAKFQLLKQVETVE